MGNRFSRSFRWIAQSLIPAPWDVWNLLVILSPAFFGAITMIAGYLQDILWMWVIMAGLISFAATSVGAVYFSQWRQWRRVADKMGFSHIRTGAKKDEKAACVIGFQMQSMADFSLECEVTSIETRIGNRVPTISAKLPQVFSVPPGGVLWFDDQVIEIDPPNGGSLAGFIEFEVVYGHPGKRREKINFKKNVVLSFNEEGLLLGGNWHDAQNQLRDPIV